MMIRSRRPSTVRMTSAWSLLLMGLVGPMAHAQGELENVIVETYYVSDTNDATDTIGGGLSAGSRTYRVYVDLCDSCALRAVYGDAAHPMDVSSTQPIFNNLDRGKPFGHEINNGALDENTVALDSWWSLGAGSTQKFGILKADDPDGSILAGNDGGSASIPGGLLVNDDPLAGAPVDSLDGLVPLNGGTALPPGFAVTGLSPDSLFGDSTAGNVFATTDTRISCTTPGVQGPTADNRILILQVTTAGELTFHLNIEVEEPDGTIIKYVWNDTLLAADEVPSGLLVYPPECGCMDPNFLEYDPAAGCDDGSCQTAIVFGCTDTLACNFDPAANFNIPLLCCYGPDSCNGLDIAIVCPDVSAPDAFQSGADWRFFPNPLAGNLLTLTWAGQQAEALRVLDQAGRLVREERMQGGTQGHRELDLGGLPAGTYLIQLITDRGPHVRLLVRG